MSNYRRIVSGFSTFKILIHKTNRLLVKYRGRILVWVFNHYTAEQTLLVTNLMNAIHDCDSFLQTGADD